MEKLYSTKTLLKMAGRGMYLPHCPSGFPPDNLIMAIITNRIRGHVSAKARGNKIFLFSESAT